MDTLTRAEAHALISEAAGDAVALRALAVLWDIPGHWNDHAQWSDDTLRDFVDSVASGDDARSNGPKDSDDTGLVAP
jgi:hypothetical protein